MKPNIGNSSSIRRACHAKAGILGRKAQAFVERGGVETTDGVAIEIPSHCDFSNTHTHIVTQLGNTVTYGTSKTKMAD